MLSAESCTILAGEGLCVQAPEGPGGVNRTVSAWVGPAPQPKDVISDPEVKERSLGLAYPILWIFPEGCGVETVNMH